jgi:hypothetical protein
MIVALVALFVALTGAGVAATGGNFILGHGNTAGKATSLSAPVVGGMALKVTNANATNAASTALSLNVADGHAPFTVSNGVKVANLNADALDGIDSSAFQPLVTGSCSGNSAITQINAAGDVGCSNVKFYSGRVVVVPGPSSATFLTIPGIAHAQVFSCQAGDAQASLVNDAPGTTDLWYDGDSSYFPTNWGTRSTPFAATAGQTYHLGKGSGSGATTITITLNTEATGSQCIFQGTAEVITS